MQEHPSHWITSASVISSENMLVWQPFCPTFSQRKQSLLPIQSLNFDIILQSIVSHELFSRILLGHNKEKHCWISNVRRLWTFVKITPVYSKVSTFLSMLVLKQCWVVKFEKIISYSVYPLWCATGQMSSTNRQNLRSEISFSRTCNFLILILYIYCTASVNALKLFTVFVSACLRAQLHAH